LNILKSVFIIPIFLFSLSNVYSTTYYLSNYGDDKNTGLVSTSAWKTIGKLNSMMSKFKPGDEVLFERNSLFIGQINLYASGDDSDPLIFGAYGSGKNPVICGSIPIENWSKYNDKIFKATVDTTVTNLFVTGYQMVIARYPNSGLLNVKETFKKDKSGFFDSELKQAPDFWKGSNVRIRTINWAYEHTPVKSFSKGNLTFLNPTFYPVQKGWGYYLDNHFSILDTAKEWYFKKGEKNSGTVFFYPSSDMNVTSSSIEGSVYSFGFYSAKNLKNIIIRDLNIRNQSITGIWFIGNNSEIRIENCTFFGQVNCGISLVNKSSKVKVNNCRFYNINGKALYLLNSSDNEISFNVFRNIGMIPGYGSTGDALPMSAIVLLQCNKTHIFNNNIRNVGHDGINSIGSDNIVEKNVLSNILLYLNDGGAIKSYGQNTKNSVWKNNFVTNVFGNLEGTNVKSNYITASGIYLDADCNGINVISNTVSNCGMAGINNYDGVKNNLYEKNIVYGSVSGIRFYQEETPITGNTVTGNIFLGLKNNENAVRLKSRSSGFIPGKFNDNYYINYSNDALFKIETGSNSVYYKPSQWLNYVGVKSELNSKVISGPETRYSKLYSNMTDDSVVIILNNETQYKDKDLKSIYSSIKVNPWSSEILFTDKEINNLPEINSAYGILDFGTFNEKEINTVKWFNLTGNNLSGEIIVTAPEGFEISFTEDLYFSKNLYFYPSNGSTDKIIFVKFTPENERLFYDLITVKAGEEIYNIKVKGIFR